MSFGEWLKMSSEVDMALGKEYVTQKRGHFLPGFAPQMAGVTLEW